MIKQNEMHYCGKGLIEKDNLSKKINQVHPNRNENTSMHIDSVRRNWKNESDSAKG